MKLAISGVRPLIFSRCILSKRVERKYSDFNFSNVAVIVLRWQLPQTDFFSLGEGKITLRGFMDPVAVRDLEVRPKSSGVLQIISTC